MYRTGIFYFTYTHSKLKNTFSSRGAGCVRDVCANCLCLCESLWKHAHESSSCYVEKDTYEFEINSILPHRIPRTCAPTLSHGPRTYIHRCVCKPHVHTHAEEISRLMPVVANVDMFAPSLAPRTRRGVLRE